MPRKYQMSWDRHQACWTKMYKGQRYVVSCYALGGPTTKEGSSEKANDWWRAKQAEIDGDLSSQPQVHRQQRKPCWMPGRVNLWSQRKRSLPLSWI